MADKMCRDADAVLSEFLAKTGEETSHHRMVEQELKCGYGLAGVCCKLCSNGPCRVSKARYDCSQELFTLSGRRLWVLHPCSGKQRQAPSGISQDDGND